MSQETLDLRRSIRIVRRHKLLVGVAVAVGCLACGAYGVLKPSTVTSTALVLLSPTGQAAQSAIAVSRHRWSRSLYANPRGDCEEHPGARGSTA